MPNAGLITAITIGVCAITLGSLTAYYAQHLIKKSRWKRRRRRVEKDWEEDETDEEKQFSAAVQFVDLNSTLIPQEMLLKLYGFFKEATEGPFEEQAEPLPFYCTDIPKRTKHSYWKAASKSGVDPMVGYVAIVDACVPDWKSRGKGVKSVLITNDDAIIDETPIGELCDIISKGDIDEVKRIITANPHLVQEVDAEEMSVLHWACDRGNEAILELLLNAGAVSLINAKDDSGMTALHYAVIAEHAGCIPVLIQKGADINIKDDDNITPLEAAQGTSVEELLNQLEEQNQNHDEAKTSSNNERE